MQLAEPIVYALPRGGVPVAAEVAARLGAPLDLLFVRKLGAPGQPEVAMGAVLDGASPEVVLTPEAQSALPGYRDYLELVARRELREIDRRRDRYLPGRRAIDPAGRTAVVVDDGLATGASVRVAVLAVKKRGAARIVVAVPVGPAEAVRALRREAEVVCLELPEPFGSVGAFYRDFHQLSDDEVIAILQRNAPATIAAREA
jgi:predicted phosphoribosyltransferase